MRGSFKTLIAATMAASLSSGAPAMAGPSDLNALIREKVRFFEKIARYGHPFQARPPLAALGAKHARPAGTATPATPAPGVRSASIAPAKTARRVADDDFSDISTMVYLSAHPDDFALFAYPYRDVVAPRTRAAFIFLTAGDAGLGAGPVGAPLYLAREAAAIRGIRFMADAGKPWPEDSTTAKVTVNGHPIYAVYYRSTAAYFLRLPDGNGDGEGFPGTGYASLSKLYSGSIATLRAIDGSTTYRGWSDLVATISAIVRGEGSEKPNVWLNANDPDTTFNPGDHADHLAAGSAAEAIQSGLPCVNAAYHVGYATAGLMNLPQDDVLNKAATFANYASGMADKNHFGAWDEAHKSWLSGLSARIALGNRTACAF